LLRSFVVIATKSNWSFYKKISSEYLYQTGCFQSRTVKCHFKKLLHTTNSRCRGNEI